MNAPSPVRQLIAEASPYKPPLSEASSTWPAPLDLAALAQVEPKSPRFIIPDWLPEGYATLLAGHGGVGKSGIALYLAVCIALGLPFFGMTVERRRVFYLSCEDRENILHWRLSRICKHLGVDLSVLAGWLDIVDLVGHDCVLWERDIRTGNTFTASYGQLEQRMTAHNTEVLFVDGISDTYGGNENARSEVKRYVNALVALISPDRGAVLLLGHLAKPAAASVQTTEGYSGSTGWHNSVRARWYLYPETEHDDDGRPGRTGDLILELQKSNLGRTDQSVRFAWDEAAHLFVGREIVGATALDRAHRDRIEQRDIRAALKACASADPVMIVPAATTGKRTAYHVLSVRQEFPETLLGGKPESRRFWRHIEILRGMGAVNVEAHRMPDRHYINHLVIPSEACGHAGNAG